MTTTAVLLAAGSGRRMGLDENKVLLPLGGMTVVAWAASALLQSARIDELVVVARPSETAVVASCLPSFDLPVRVVEGGAERHDSARAGVAAATGDVLLIHDAARPFPSRELIERVLDGVERYGACIPVVRVVDTLRRLRPDGFADGVTVDRTHLAQVQTPQGFRAELLRAALAGVPPGVHLTDDAAAVLLHGARVYVTEGDARNIKITTPTDLHLASQLAQCVERA